MVIELARHWWTLALRGVAAIVFGLIAWAWPDLTVTALVIMFGAYALVDGVFALAAAVTGDVPMSQRAWLVLEGIACIAAAVIAVVWPDITALSLIFVIGAWAIVTGIFELVAAIRLRDEIEDEVWLGLSGIASILFGLVVTIFPGSGAIALVWLIGAYSIVFGALMIALAFRLRQWQHRGPIMSTST